MSSPTAMYIAAPRQIRMFVRKPAGFLLSSRSRPITAPHNAAIPHRTTNGRKTCPSLAQSSTSLSSMTPHYTDQRSTGAYNYSVAGHECYHCKQWIAEGEAHDCWTTTEAALTRHLSEYLRDAYERLRESASELGEQ